MNEAERDLKRQIEQALLLNAGLGAACLEDPELGGLFRELRSPGPRDRLVDA